MTVRCFKRRWDEPRGVKYEASHIEDECGALGDQALDLDEFSAFEICQEEFVVA